MPLCVRLSEWLGSTSRLAIDNRVVVFDVLHLYHVPVQCADFAFRQPLCSKIKLRVMIGTEHNDIARNVWTVVRTSERFDVMRLGIRLVPWQSDGKTAELTPMLVELLQLSSKFSISQDSIDLGLHPFRLIRLAYVTRDLCLGELRAQAPHSRAYALHCVEKITSTETGRAR